MWLICLQTAARGTAIVILVSRDAIVLGVDGKGVDTVSGDPFGVTTEQKLAVLRNRFIVSTIGVSRIRRNGVLAYDFTSWVKSIAITNAKSVLELARLIARNCWPIFHDEWRLARPTTPFNLSRDPSLPVVGYYVAGEEIDGPKVYFIGTYADWSAHKLKYPKIKQIYPPTTHIQRRNIYAIFHGKTGGGMDQLTMEKSPIRNLYLRLYDKEIGALVYDEPLGVESLTELGRIMLTIEVTVSPSDFAFPLNVCSTTPEHGPTCHNYQR